MIPAHNEAAYIRGTLDALRRQNYGWMEVIVVANGCTDGTPEVAKGRCHRLITISRKNLGVARNLGARMARGDILVFLDADTLLEPMAIRRVAEDFSEEHAAGTVRGVPDSPRLPYRAVYWCKNAVHRLRLHAGSSGVILCWRTHFMCVGGFDEDLQVRENSHLMKRLLRFGKYQYVGDVAAMTSMRRFERRGFSKVAWLWIKVWVQSVFGDLRQRQYEIVR
jgi:glycosyltransferase involved in cell wall biosynthesis